MLKPVVVTEEQIIPSRPDEFDRIVLTLKT